MSSNTWITASELAKKTGADLLDAAEACEYDLERIASVLRTAIGDNRDALLEVGGLCHHFVKDRLARGYAAQGSRMLLRDKLSEAAGRQINPGRWTTLYFVATLLGDGDCGSMSLSVLKEFGLFVCHNRKQEIWTLKEEHQADAVQMFTEAREKQWGRDVIRRVMQTRFPEQKKYGRKYAPRYRVKIENEMPHPLAALKYAAVQDAGALLAQVITDHSDSDRLIKELLKLIPKLKG